MYSACAPTFVCIWCCKLVKAVLFSICNGPLMKLTMVDDDSLTIDNWSMAEDVDDVVAGG